MNSVSAEVWGQCKRYQSKVIALLSELKIIVTEEKPNTPISELISAWTDYSFVFRPFMVVPFFNDAATKFEVSPLLCSGIYLERLGQSSLI